MPFGKEQGCEAAQADETPQWWGLQAGSRHRKLHSLWGRGSDIVFDMQAKQGGLHKTQLVASLALAQVSLVI